MEGIFRCCRRDNDAKVSEMADYARKLVKAQNGKIISSRDEHANGNGHRQSGMQTLDELVSGIIDERIHSGQLDECDLMVRDIARIRLAFISTLQGIYHPRVDYTPQLVKT